MRAIMIVLVVVALAAAGGVSYFANQLLDSARTAATPAAEPAPAAPSPTLVAVAARDMLPGQSLTAESLRWQPWPADVVREDYAVVRPEAADPAAAKAEQAGRFEGKIARRPIAAGQPLTDALVFARGEAGFLAGALEPGHRAVSIPVTVENAAAGFVLPGDRVDVLMAMDLRNSRDDSDETYEKLMGTAPIIRYVAETVIEDVRVLAIDQQMTQPEEAAAQVAAVATLEVTPAEAEALTITGRMGALTLALRALGDRQPGTADAGGAPPATVSQHARAAEPGGAAAPAGDVSGHNAGEAARTGRRDARAFVGDLHVSNTLATMMTTAIAAEMAEAEARWDVIIHRGTGSGTIQTFRRDVGPFWRPGPEQPYGAIPVPGEEDEAVRDAAQAAATGPGISGGGASHIVREVLR